MNRFAVVFPCKAADDDLPLLSETLGIDVVANGLRVRKTVTVVSEGRATPSRFGGGMLTKPVC